MRVAFLGTPDVAVPSLEGLASTEDVVIVIVITQPDRPRGRSKEPQPPPVKLAAELLGIPVHQPTSSRDIRAILAESGGLDLAVVVAYGVLIRPEALEVPSGGFVNLHFSVLPRWRGAAPVQRAIEARDARIGTTVMQLDAGLDTGPILSTMTTRLDPGETAGEVFARLAETGARHLTDVVDRISTGTIVATSQRDADATHAAKILPDERLLSPGLDAESVIARIHSLSPTPGVGGMLGGERFKLLRAARTSSLRSGQPPGTMSFSQDRLLMETGTDPIELSEVQPAGKRVMTGADWARGQRGDLGALE